MNEEKKRKPIKSPIELFFKLGSKVTGNDPQRQMDFTYYMIWILFLAFASMFFINIINFFQTWDLNSLVWALVGFAIMSLQFISLKNLYHSRKLTREAENQAKKISEEKEVIEGVDDMLKGFEPKKEDSNNIDDELSGTEVLDIPEDNKWDKNEHE